jgi:hypothetical protein
LRRADHSSKESYRLSMTHIVINNSELEQANRLRKKEEKKFNLRFDSYISTIDIMVTPRYLCPHKIISTCTSSPPDIMVISSLTRS